MTKRVKVSITLVTITLFFVLQLLLFNYHKAQIDRAHANVKEQLSAHAIALKTVIEEKYTAMHGLIAFIHTVGFDADEHTIMAYLQELYSKLPATKTLILAPKGVITYIYPITGNEPILGTNYLEASPLASVGSVLQTLESGEIIVDGPRELMQGGYGLVIRSAMYNEGRFEGIAAITLDMKSLLQKASVDKLLSHNPSFAIKKLDGAIWFGNGSTFDDEHISTQITLQDEVWVMAAKPNREALHLIWRNSILMELLGLVSIFVVSYTLLYQKRFNKHLEKLVNKRTQALRKANTELLKAEGELRYRNDLLEKRTQELELSERKYELLAYLDSLTGISNRLHFTEHLQLLLSPNESHDKKVALYFLDLNQFKDVNDTLGHPVGDQLLAAVADRIKHSSLHFQHFARTGGDEFILIFDDIEDLVDVQQNAERILALFSLPFNVNQLEIGITTSIGISIYPDDGQTSEELMKHADLAMYQAKAEGGNQYRLFDHAMLNQLLGKTELAIDLNRAISKDQLMIYYQPIIEIQSETIVGLEALLRWRHPTKGMVSPAEFIPIAEETGLINPLTDWVLNEVCRQHHKWVKQGLAPIKISVNLSGAWFYKKDREQEFYQLLHQYGIESRYIEVEITERVALMDDYYPILEGMLAEGITVAVDDFGTDYSSLSYLKRFPINKIKIDKSFINGIGKNPIDETIIQAIFFVAQQLNYTVVAEGVETYEQAEFLKAHGCHYAQGFLYYRPTPVTELEHILREQLLEAKLPLN